jgi:hypothetical protein
VPVCLTTVDTFWPAFFFVGSISAFFLLPLFILIVLYSVIAKHLMINPSLISAQGNRSNFIKYRKQVIFMLAAVVISFFTCLLPFRAFTLWIILADNESIMSLMSSDKGESVDFSKSTCSELFPSTGVETYYTLLYFCRIMWYLNSAMNPILYNLMSSKFREGFVKLLGCKPLIRKTSWSDSARKGTFHTTSTNLSSSNHGHAATRNAHFGANDIKSVERAPLNVIKYVKIVVAEKIECLEAANMNGDSMCESESRERGGNGDETPDKNVNISRNISISSYTNKQKSNYRSDEDVKISIKSCNNDECLSDEMMCGVDEDEIDSVETHEQDFCINIYNLLSAKESLV